MGVGQDAIAGVGVGRDFGVCRATNADGGDVDRVPAALGDAIGGGVLAALVEKVARHARPGSWMLSSRLRATKMRGCRCSGDRKTYKTKLR